MNKKLLLTFVLIIGGILGLMLAFSYAYYTFDKGSTVFNTTTHNENIDIDYETSEYVNVSNAIPIDDKYVSTMAASNRFSITVKGVNNTDTIAEVLLSISLVNITMDDSLKNEYFKYQLIHNSKIIKEGTGLDFTGSSFEMVSNEVIYSDLPNNFIFRIWISENGLDQNSMKDSTFTGSIEINAVKTRNVENNRSIMMAQSSSSAFWQSAYKTNITSIDFKSNIEVPSTAIVVNGENNYWNISKSGSKGKVIAYIEDDGISDDSVDTGYKLTIGGEGVVYASNCSNLFNGMSNVKSINFNDSFNTSLSTVMSSMFNGMTNLVSLDVSSFDTSNVKKMDSMFSGMTNFVSLDLTNFDTSNVDDMYYMFAKMTNLNELHIESFNTAKVTKMTLMFAELSSLTSLDVSSFNTSNVTAIWGMFQNMSKLTSLDVSNFDTSSVTNMSSMFRGTSSLKELNLSGFDTSNVTSMYYMFSGASGLVSLDVSHFDTSGVKDMEQMFANMTSLLYLNLTGFDTSSATTMKAMFSGLSNITTLDISSFDTSNVTTMDNMFFAGYKLSKLIIGEDFDTSNVENMNKMFWRNRNLKLDCSEWNVDKVTVYTEFGRDCSLVIPPVWVN